MNHLILEYISNYRALCKHMHDFSYTNNVIMLLMIRLQIVHKQFATPGHTLCSVTCSTVYRWYNICWYLYGCQNTLLLTEITSSSNATKAWINNYIHIKQWDVSGHPCINVNGWEMQFTEIGYVKYRSAYACYIEHWFYFFPRYVCVISTKRTI